MAHVFIFAKDIEDALKQGKKEVEFPEGVRISSAALDLIKERNITVKYVSTKAESDDASTGTRDVSAELTPLEEGEAEQGPEAKESKTISEEDVEEIARRVLERFRQIRKGDAVTSGDKKIEEADDDDLVICRCEEITKGEIKEALRNGMKTLNGVKRITRAGMGLCQGQTCQRLVSQILASELGVAPGELEPTTARAPVRPVKLAAFATG